MAKQNNEKLLKRSDVKPIVAITLKLIVISVITALLLSCVNALTKDKIAANETAEKERAISEIFGAGISAELIDLAAEGISELYSVSENGDELGYAAVVTPLGFGGDITMMVGVAKDGTVSGVRIISYSETPGLGTRVGEADYLAKYMGKNSSSFDTVDVISGSTVSSKAVKEGVKAALSAHGTVFGNAGITDNDAVDGETAKQDGGAE